MHEVFTRFGQLCLYPWMRENLFTIRYQILKRYNNIRLGSQTSHVSPFLVLTKSFSPSGILIFSHIFTHMYGFYKPIFLISFSLSIIFIIYNDIPNHFSYSIRNPYSIMKLSKFHGSIWE